MNDTTADQQPRDAGEPSSMSGPAATRRLTRRTDQKVFGGVASGLATYFNIDPVICRLGFVAFGLVTFPFGVLLYLIAWAVIPPDTSDGTGLRSGNGVPSWVWIALVACMAVFLLFPLVVLGVVRTDLGTLFWPGLHVGFGPGLFWALLLIGLGVLLFQRSERVEPLSTGSNTALPAHVSTDAPAAARPPRRPSILGRLAVAAALVMAGAAALLHNLGVLGLGSRRLLALLLLVVGVALLIGAWWGTARWLIVVGALLVPALFSISVVETFAVPARGPFGDRSWRPTSLAEVAKPFEVSLGDLTLDLTRLPLSGDVTRVTADVGMGDVEVIVPADADVTVTSRVGLGRIDVFGHRRDGAGIRVTDHAAGPRDGERLVLDVEDGLGAVTVRRALTTSPEGQ
jgi:phage shock protein PspC (stress-responsive transcriptional regulator)